MPVWPGTMSSITVPPKVAAALQSSRYSSAVPKTGSICVVMRSKCPSTVGVARQPRSPPADFTGPVWTASIPMWLKAFQRFSSPSVVRNEVPGALSNEIGYAVNHTDAVSTAARGSGRAKGFCHMIPVPESWRAIVFAYCSMDCSTSHATYAGFSDVAGPCWPEGVTVVPLLRCRATARNGRGLAGKNRSA